MSILGIEKGKIKRKNRKIQAKENVIFIYLKYEQPDQQRLDFYLNKGK